MHTLFRPIIKRAATLLRVPVSGDVMVQLFVKSEGVVNTPITIYMKCKTERDAGVQVSPAEVMVDIPKRARSVLWGHNVAKALAYVELLCVKEFQEEALKVVLENRAQAKDVVRREFLVPLRTQPYPAAGQSCTFSKSDVNEYLSKSIISVVDPVKRKKGKNVQLERDGKTWLEVK